MINFDGNKIKTTFNRVESNVNVTIQTSFIDPIKSEDRDMFAATKTSYSS